MTLTTGHTPKPERLAAVADILRRFSEGYPRWGAPFYGALAARAAETPQLVALASQSPERGEGFQLFATVHYLLLRDSSDPLARYFPTFTEGAVSSDKAFDEFARFCTQRRGDIEQVLATRTVQQTYVERCSKVMPAISRVADAAGEPLNLIEIGCSAGVLLSFDSYAYNLGACGRVGPQDAPLTLDVDYRGGPCPRIPKIGARIGLDLQPLDPRLEDNRLWTMANTFPESRDERARLATALDVVRQSDIEMLKGDALDLLPRALAKASDSGAQNKAPGPVCVFHSACLMHWPQDSKEALHRLLLAESQQRDIYRIGAEPPEAYFQQEEDKNRPTAEIRVTLYRKGTAELQALAYSDAQSSFFHWVNV